MSDCGYFPDPSEADYFEALEAEAEARAEHDRQAAAELAALAEEHAKEELEQIAFRRKSRDWFALNQKEAADG